MKHQLIQAGLDGSVRVDSAGTGAWHVGESPDSRSRAVALANGVDVEGSARRVEARDFHEFDYVLAMDRANLRDLERLHDTSGGDARVELFRSFDPDASGDLDVPDPYYGGSQGFDRAYEMVDRTCRALVERIGADLSEE